MSIKMMLKEMADRNASELYYHVGGPVYFKIDGHVAVFDNKKLTMEELVRAVDTLTTPKQREILKEKLDIDFATYIEELNIRCRVSIFIQRNWPAIVVRNIPREIKKFEDLNLPAQILEKVSMEKRGLVLLTGSMGSGKSTAISSMIDYINNNSPKHILTIEEPIEYMFEDKKCVINQRELGLDVSSYKTALRSFTLQSPDVIYIGNIRDIETMSSALTAAETGVLVLSTLHTVNAVQSIERITNFFPQHQHQEIRNQLAFLLKAVISLRLVPLKEGPGRIPAYEAMVQTPTISALIREGRINEIHKFVQEGEISGMQTFNQSLIKLVRENKISEEAALEFSDNKEELNQSLRGIIRSEWTRN